MTTVQRLERSQEELDERPWAPEPRALRVVPSRPSVAKRVMDVAIALFMLILLLPLFALVAIAIRLGDGGPVFYRQRRVGYASRPFEILKFRSMVVDAERLTASLADQNINDGLLFKLERDPRVTPVGRVIRRLSIDEMPQLWNVLRGDMSLVGPRPLPVPAEAFSPAERRRHDVLPGITGLWQVSGANELSYRQMIELDLAYVERRSLAGDIGIIVRTIPALMGRTMPV